MLISYFCMVKIKHLKDFFKHIFDLYIILNIHVALAVTALYLVFNLQRDMVYMIFLFTSTIVSYNLIRLISFGSNRFFIKKYYARYKRVIIWFLVTTGLSMLISFFKLDLTTQIALIPLFIITFMYNFDYKNLPKFRDNGILKILIVGFVWAGLVILIPQFQSIDQTIILRILLVFFYIVMLTTGFDKRDILIDRSNLKTLPQLFPNRMFLVYLIFFIILSVLNFLLYQTTNTFWINESIIFLSSLMSYRSNTEKSFYYTAFWLEAMPFFWFLLTFITKKNPTVISGIFFIKFLFVRTVQV